MQKLLGAKIESVKMGQLVFFSDLYPPCSIQSYTPHALKTYRNIPTWKQTKNKQNLTHIFILTVMRVVEYVYNSHLAYLVNLKQGRNLVSINKMDSYWEMTANVVLWPLHSGVHMRTSTYMSPCTCVCTFLRWSVLKIAQKMNIAI